MKLRNMDWSCENEDILTQCSLLTCVGAKLCRPNLNLIRRLGAAAGPGQGQCCERTRVCPVVEFLAGLGGGAGRGGGVGLRIAGVFRSVDRAEYAAEVHIRSRAGLQEAFRG